MVALWNRADHYIFAQLFILMNKHLFFTLIKRKNVLVLMVLGVWNSVQRSISCLELTTFSVNYSVMLLNVGYMLVAGVILTSRCTVFTERSRVSRSF